MPGARGRGGRGGRAGYSKTLRDHAAIVPEIFKPREQFPPIQTPKQPVISPTERAVAGHFHDFRDQLRQSPIYKALETDLRVPKPGELSGRRVVRTNATPKSKFESPFDSMKTWATRSNTTKLAVPDLKGRKYDKRLFPTELHAVIGGSGAAPSSQASKRLKLEADAEDEQAADEDEDVFAIDQDDSFEDDDDEGTDGPDDYNAEAYFDNGEGDGDDDGRGDYAD